MIVVFRFVAVVLLLISFHSCINEPTISCKDCDEFRCDVNGTAFKPSGPWKSTTLSAITINDTAIAIGANNGNEFIGIGIKLSEPIKIGSYDLGVYPPGRGTYSNDTYKNSHYTNNIYKGKFIITRLAYGSRPVMEGTFYYDAQSLINQSVTHVTNGSFKLYFTRY